MTRRLGSFLSIHLVALVALLTLVGGVAVPSQAGRWAAEELGETRPFYAEHRFGVNADGRAAWTALVGGAPRARGYTGSSSVDLHALLPAGSSLSYGQDTGSHSHVVGYSATSARESERRAVLWRWTGASWTGVLDLHAAAVAAAGAPQQQTAAYAVSDVTGGGEIHVAGFRRERVGSGGTYSVPLVWATNALTSSVVQVHELDLGGFQYGIAYGVTDDGVVVGGVGQASGGASYMVAAWWELSVDADNDGRPDLNLVPGMQVADGWSTSVANRVRRLTINGDVGSYAVGTAFDAGGVLHAFVHRVGPGGWTDADGFVLPGGANALAFDVAVGSIAGQQGLQVVGGSNDAGGALPDAHQPNTAHRTFGAQLLDVGANAQVCDIMDGMPAAASTVALLNGASGGEVSGLERRVGWGDGRAWLLSRQPYQDAIQLIVRDTTTASIVQPAVQSFRVVAPGATTTGSLLWSHSAGCALASGCVDGTLDLADEPGAVRVPLDGHAGGRAFSAPLGGTVPTTGWVQASGTHASCTMTPVQRLQDVSRALNPPGTHWNGIDLQGNWANCDGNAANVAETNLLAARDHCGSCNNGVDDALACTNDACVNGAAVNTVQPNRCVISGTCRNQGDRNTVQLPIMTGTVNDACPGSNPAPVTVGNPCVRCDHGSDPRGWTTFTSQPCCEADGTPRLDVYDRTGYLQSARCAAGRLGVDLNHGRARNAWWIDARNLDSNNNWNDWNSYNQNGRWSDGTACNAVASSGVNAIQNIGRDVVRRIDANFTPGIDTVDWYATVYDDAPNNAVTPKPRGRLISRSMHPTAGRPVRLQMCLFIDCMDGARNRVELKDVRFRGTGWHSGVGAAPSNITGQWLYDANPEVGDSTGGFPDVYPGSFSPAHDGRGPCFETDDNGVLDISVWDYDCHNTALEEAWVYYRITLLDTGVDHLSCDQLNYTLYYGNDRGPGGNNNGGGWTAGCDTCCN